MIKFGRVAAIVGVAVALVGVPNSPAFADSMSRYAHAGFYDMGDQNTNMYIDVRGVNGVETIDVEWSQGDCATVDGVYRCDNVFRYSEGVPVSSFAFSLQAATASAVLPYEEIRRACVAVDEETMDCAETRSTGTTNIELTWTAISDPQKSEWTDEQGQRHLSLVTESRTSGTAFGQTFLAEYSASQLAQGKPIGN